MRFAILAIIFLASFSGIAQAGDVHVNGYYRKDGTYVRSHIRSAPDGIKSNNYGPSTSSSQLMNPQTRDYDRDGSPNYLDMNDDNDSLLDNYDGSQYGR